MEASALQAPAVVTRTRTPLGPLLRLRSDDQLVALFRAGHDEAFRVIHDRYRQRLFAYTRQMLPGRQDAEDALQDVFIRAYANLRATDRKLALRAWLYRVAHNRCVDELRRPVPPPPETLQFICTPIQDPISQADQRESLRRLVADVRRLPDHQRSALLMRELEGLSYADLAETLGVSVAAVKSLLVRARMALALAMEARETACAEIREDLILAHDRRTRAGATARRHLRDCPSCAQFRRELRGMSRQLAGLTPALGPLGVVAKILGIGSGAGGGAAATGGGVVFGGAAGTGAAASAGALATGASHVATLIAATVVTAGGAVEIQGTIIPPVHHRIVHHARTVAPRATAIALPSGGPASEAAYPPVATAAAAIAEAVVKPADVAPASEGPVPAGTAGRTNAVKANRTVLTVASVAGTGGATSSTAPKRTSAGPGTYLPSLAASATRPAETSSTASTSTSSSSSSTSATPEASPSTGTGAGTTGAKGSTTGAHAGTSSSGSTSSSTAAPASTSSAAAASPATGISSGSSSAGGTAAPATTPSR